MMFDRILNRGRVRVAARRLASEPSVRNYVLLAQAHASTGQLSEVAKVCDEGLAIHASSTELRRMKERAVALSREDRVRTLLRELKTSPRPALWKELCEIQLEAGRVARAEKAAAEWFDSIKSEEALYYRARARAERYFTDRRRDDARRALELAAECVRLDPGDQRPMRLRLSIFTRCGAWQDARTSLARLLELVPGDPALEARFRTVASLAEKSQTLDQALREVERTGTFVDDEADGEPQTGSRSIRPLLQSTASEPGVRAAFYVRGGTALVQGPRGATAERYARGVRELVGCGRSTARRLGLGQPMEMRFEGEFGALTIRTGPVGAAALWTAALPTRKHTEALTELAAFEGIHPEMEA